MLRTLEMRLMQEVGFEWKGLLKMLKVADIIRTIIGFVDTNTEQSTAGMRYTAMKFVNACIPH